MAKIIEWPLPLLTPQKVSASVVPFTRSGGTTLGGLTPSTSTDLGYWRIDYAGIPLRTRTREQWQAWQAIRQTLGGRSGLVAVPVRSAVSAPYETGRFEPVSLLPHDDGALFRDGSAYVQGAIAIVTDGATEVGATTIRLKLIKADTSVSGVRFSHEHALYETGPVIDVEVDVWTVSIWPAVRAGIPDGTYLEFDRPTCLCHLAEDDGMAIDIDYISKNSAPSVSFVEAVDYWASL